MTSTWATRISERDGATLYRTIQGTGQSGSGMTSGASHNAGHRPAKIHAADATGAALCGQRFTARAVRPRYERFPVSGRIVDMLTCPKCIATVSF